MFAESGASSDVMLPRMGKVVQALFGSLTADFTDRFPGRHARIPLQFDLSHSIPPLALTFLSSVVM